MCLYQMFIVNVLQSPICIRGKDWVRLQYVYKRQANSINGEGKKYTKVKIYTLKDKKTIEIYQMDIEDTEKRLTEVNIILKRQRLYNI